MRWPPATRKRTLRALGAYYVVTGVWPFVSRRTFEAVTGPKREWWLVQTVGGLVTAVGAGALLASRPGRTPPEEVVVVCAGSAATLAGIDVVYVARGRIAPTYLLDAAVELVLLAGLGPTRPRGPSRARPRRGRGSRQRQRRRVR